MTGQPNYALNLLLIYAIPADTESWGQLSPGLDRIVSLAHASLETELPHIDTVRQLSDAALPRTTAAYSAAVRIIGRYAKNDESYSVETAHEQMQRLLYNAIVPENNNETAALCLLALVQNNMSVLVERQLRLSAVNYNLAADGAEALDERVIFRLLAQTCESFPVFHTYASPAPWSQNVAGCLVHVALKSDAYDCITVLLNTPAFVKTCSVDTLNQMQEYCCRALLSVRALQRTQAEETVLFISEDHARQITELATHNVDVSQTSRELLITLGTVDQLVRLREAAEKRATGTGHATLVEMVPDVRVQQAAAELEIAVDLREHMLSAIQAIRANLIRAQLRPRDNSPFEKDTMEYANKLLALIAEKEPATSPDLFDIKSENLEPKWPLGQSMSIIHELLMTGACASAPNETWLHIALMHIVYRYYAHVIFPEQPAKRAALNEARDFVQQQKDKESAGDQAIQELRARIFAISAAAYLGED